MPRAFHPAHDGLAVGGLGARENVTETLKVDEGAEERRDLDVGLGDEHGDEELEGREDGESCRRRGTGRRRRESRRRRSRGKGRRRSPSAVGDDLGSSLGDVNCKQTRANREAHGTTSARLKSRAEAG
jgi:hypothetical protein